MTRAVLALALVAFVGCHKAEPPQPPVRQFGQRADFSWDCPPGCLCETNGGETKVLRCGEPSVRASLDDLAKQVELLDKEVKRNAELVDKLTKLLAKP